MNAAKRSEIFARLRAANPSPTTELEYASTFQLLVAVILSAQATDKSVNIATRTLFADAPTPQAMLALGEDGLTEYINRIGLAKGKTPLAVELKLLKAVPDEYKQDAHHWLILHGRYVCKARRPECWRCELADLCEYPDKAHFASTPNKG